MSLTSLKRGIASAVLFVMGGSLEAHAGPNKAFIIGSQCGHSSAQQIAAVQNPANDLDAALRGKSWETSKLIGEVASYKTQFLNGVKAAYCAQETTQILMAFVGHGSQWRNGVEDHSLCLDPNQPTSHIYMSEINSAIQAAKNNCKSHPAVRLALIDMSCKSGGGVYQLKHNICVLANSAKGSTSYGKGGPIIATTQILSDDAKAAKLKPLNPNSRKITLDQVFLHLLLNPPGQDFISQPQISGCLDKDLYKGQTATCGINTDIGVNTSTELIQKYVIGKIQPLLSQSTYSGIPTLLTSISVDPIHSVSDIDAYLSRATAGHYDSAAIKKLNEDINKLQTQLEPYTVMQATPVDFNFNYLNTATSTTAQRCLFSNRAAIAAALNFDQKPNVRPSGVVFIPHITARAISWMTRSKVAIDALVDPIAETLNCSNTTLEELSTALTDFLYDQAGSNISSFVVTLPASGNYADPRSKISQQRTLYAQRDSQNRQASDSTQYLRDARTYGYVLCQKRALGTTPAGIQSCQQFELRDAP